MNIKPSDIIEVPNHTNGCDLYSVLGVYLGGLNTDSLVELAPLTQNKGSSGPILVNIFVPLRMIEWGVRSGAFNLTSIPEPIEEKS